MFNEISHLLTGPQDNKLDNFCEGTMQGKHRVLWLFHGTAMVGDYPRTVNWLIDFTGCRVLQDEEDFRPGIARRGGMTWIAGNSLELAEPRGSGGPTQRFLDRHGPGMHSIALQVEDIDATIKHLSAHGVRIASRPLPNFAWTDPRDTGGLLLEWFSTAEPHDPRFGATIPPHHRPPLLEARKWAAIGGIVADPMAVADRLSTLLGLPITFVAEDAPAGAPVIGVSTNDCTIALYRLPDVGSALNLWGSAIALARVHLMTLIVDDLSLARRVLQSRGIRLLRDEPDFILPHPQDSGDLSVGLTSSLLPGDPRCPTRPLCLRS